jgi:hypothetical protein
MAIRRVTSNEFDGSTVTTTFGKTEIRALKASYADNLETETIPEQGSQRQGARTPGIYKTEDVSISFRSSVFRAELLPLLPSRGAGLAKVAIVVSFFHPEIGSDSDMLAGARLVNLSAATEASAKALEVETKWVIDQIHWTSRRITINSLNGAIPIGTVRL